MATSGMHGADGSPMLAHHERRTAHPVTFLRGRQPLPRWVKPALGGVLLIALLALAWWAYHPGLSGDFLFDDFANLPALGATGPVTHWATFWRYITSGNADPTGRPLTLLTFLVDARDWPASPYSFKVTNVILHLLNGVLLAWVLWKLGTFLAKCSTTSSFRTSRSDDPESVSRLHAGWNLGDAADPKTDSGFDPSGRPGMTNALELDPSSRPGMTNALELDPSSRPGMTNALGLDPAGRPGMTNALELDPSSRPGITIDRRSCAIAALFGAGAWLLHPLFVSTTLYIVQREAMLPATFVLIGLLGWIASREALARGHVQRAVSGMALSAWLCTALAAAYLLYLLPGAIQDAPVTRGWTVGERLLTEARVLADYLRLLVIPHAHSSGLFNDAFPLSTGWLQPASTLPCIALILALIGAGFALRKRHPAIALALLFYFAAQLMESGWIALELYYEHRNYLPAMLLFWPIGLGLARPGKLRWAGVAAAGCILLVLGMLTWQRASLWGDGLQQAQLWAAINPDSARAQANAALYDLAHDQPRLAIARLERSLPRHPDDIQAPINLIGAECRLGAVRRQTLDAAEYALARTRLGGQTAFKWFDGALEMAGKRSCEGLDFAALQAILDAVGRNPHWRDIPGRQQDLHHLQGQQDLAEGKPDAALMLFNRALAASPAPGPALEQAAYLGAHGYPKAGLAHLDYFATLPPGPKPGFGMPRIHAWILREQGWWPKETAYLRHTLETDAASEQVE